MMKFRPSPIVHHLSRLLLLSSHLRPASSASATPSQLVSASTSTSRAISSSQFFNSADSVLQYAANMTTQGPVIAISHGGGPMPLLGDPNHKDLVQSLRTKVPQVLRLGTDSAPRAIVLVTAHWSEENPTISSASRHKLYYDYGGFPPEAYRLKYDAPGSPDVAREVQAALKEAGFAPQMDEERGWDHGVFVPMKLIAPEARIPIIQLSVLSSESPSAHFAMGVALSKLRASNIAIIGSGFPTLHNLRIMLTGQSSNPAFKARNHEFSEAVSDATLEPDVEARRSKFELFRKWPHSFEMHPRYGAEHFLPLIVCAGAAGEGKGNFYTDDFMGLDYYSFYWD